MARLVIWEEYSVTNTVLAGGNCSPAFILLEDNGRDIFFIFLHILSEQKMLCSASTSRAVKILLR